MYSLRTFLYTTQRWTYKGSYWNSFLVSGTELMFSRCIFCSIQVLQSSNYIKDKFCNGRRLIIIVDFEKCFAIWTYFVEYQKDALSYQFYWSCYWNCIPSETNRSVLITDLPLLIVLVGTVWKLFKLITTFMVRRNGYDHVRPKFRIRHTKSSVQDSERWHCIFQTKLDAINYYKYFMRFGILFACLMCLAMLKLFRLDNFKNRRPGSRGVSPFLFGSAILI